VKTGTLETDAGATVSAEAASACDVLADGLAPD